MVDGFHILADMVACRCSDSYYTDDNIISEYLQAQVLQSGLTPVGSFFHSFGNNQGFTGVIVLAESHVSIHTWPEYRTVNIDVYSCNVTQDNSNKARMIYEKLRDLYNPVSEKYKEVIR